MMKKVERRGNQLSIRYIAKLIRSGFYQTNLQDFSAFCSDIHRKINDIIEKKRKGKITIKIGRKIARIYFHTVLVPYGKHSKTSYTVAFHKVSPTNNYFAEPLIEYERTREYIDCRRSWGTNYLATRYARIFLGERDNNCEFVLYNKNIKIIAVGAYGKYSITRRVIIVTPFGVRKIETTDIIYLNSLPYVNLGKIFNLDENEAKKLSRRLKSSKLDENELIALIL